MYVILIIDNHNITLYSGEQFAKTYSSIIEAEKEVKSLVEVENKLFGNNSLIYQIVEVG